MDTMTATNYWATEPPKRVKAAVLAAAELSLRDAPAAHTALEDSRLDPEQLLAFSTMLLGGFMVGPGVAGRFAQARTQLLARTNGDGQTAALEVLSSAESWAGCDISHRRFLVGRSPYHALDRAAVACQLVGQVAEALADDIGVDVAEIFTDLRSKFGIADGAP